MVSETGNVAGGRLLDSPAPARSQVAHGPYDPRLRRRKLFLRATEALQTLVSPRMSPEARPH